MEVFVIAHYEMKQRKGAREGRRGPHLRKGRRDPFCILGSSIESLTPFGEIESLP
jgi:hypothetical protein